MVLNTRMGLQILKDKLTIIIDIDFVMGKLLNLDQSSYYICAYTPVPLPIENSV